MPGHGTQPCSHVCIYIFYIEYACTILLCAINHFSLHSRAVLNWREDKHTVIARTVFVDWSVCVCVCVCVHVLFRVQQEVLQVPIYIFSVVGGRQTACSADTF